MIVSSPLHHEESMYPPPTTRRRGRHREGDEQERYFLGNVFLSPWGKDLAIGSIFFKGFNTVIAVGG